MNPSSAWSAETLLQHELFVRAVVRGLLSDEGRVQDVIQETWLTALRRPPRTGAPLRAWLGRVAANLARDSHRRTSRRTVRERASARPEAVESVAVTWERLAAQREVVDAVLSLAEPYRSVVLMHYYQDLDAAAIGQRLGRSPATVRSQLSRAHESLRSSLDARFDGGRSTWASLLLPLAANASPLEPLWTATTAKLVAAVAAAGVVGLVVLPGLVGREEARQPSAPAVVRETAGPSPEVRATASTSALRGTGRVPVDAQRPAAIAPDERAELGSRSVEEHLELAVQTQRALERRLLTPDRRVVAEHAGLLALPGTGLCRLLAREPRVGALPRRGGGSYYSFATREPSYDAEPDLSFRGGRFDAGFYGTQLGLLAELGDVPLEELSPRGVLPGGLGEGGREAWGVLWSDLELEDAAHGSDFRRRTQALQRSIAPAGTDATYLLRVFSPGEHDHVVAFRPVELDAEACTLAWRVLATWPVPGERRAPFERSSEHPEVPRGPAWLEDLSADELLELLDGVRAAARADLLEVPQRVVDDYARLLGRQAMGFGQRQGFGRIVPRESWAPLVATRGGGAYYSFSTGSNDYDRSPELSLERGRYASGFAGSQQGWLLELGALSFEELGVVLAGNAPSDLTDRQLEAWDLMGSARATFGHGDGRTERALPPAVAERAAELGLGRDVPAVPGRTYLLRSILFPEHDHLVVFTVVEGDERGHTLAWKVLRSWPVEAPSRGR